MKHLRTASWAIFVIAFATQAQARPAKAKGPIVDPLHPVITAKRPPIQPPDQPPTTARETLPEVGPDHRFVVFTTSATNENGTITPQTNSYWHLEAGINFTNKNGDLEASKASFEIRGGNAVAENLQFKVKLKGNSRSVGAVTVVQSDGAVLQSHVAGLRFYDPVTGKAVVLSETKDTGGQLTGENQVVYRDAFESVNADLCYTLRLNGLEQDVILYGSLPSPSQYGLDPSSTRLEVMTEFENPPKRKLISRQGRLPERAEETGKPMSQSESEDVSVDFGAMRIGAGRAFSTGQDSNAIGVGKRWMSTQGREFLIEAVELNRAREFLDALPKKTGAQTTPKSGRKAVLEARRSVDAVPGIQRAERKGMIVRGPQKSSEPTGFVMDYVVYNTPTTYNNFVFQGDQTYYVSGAFSFTGNTVIEGGAVIKFPKLVGSADGTLWISGTLDCQTSPYRPAIFAPCDDNTIGQGLPGSLNTGPLDQAQSYGFRAIANWYGAPALNIHDIRFVQVAYAVYLANQANNSVHNCQIISKGWSWTSGITIVGNPSSSTPYTTYVGNVLFSSLGIAIGYQFPVANTVYINLENVTSDNNNYFCVRSTWSLFKQVTMRNCLQGPLWVSPYSNDILSAPGTEYIDLGGNSVYTDRPTWNALFTSAASAHFYLPANSALHGTSVQAGSDTLLNDLKTATTYPPTTLSTTTYTSPLVLAPIVSRDISLLDPGYHYPAVDYLSPGITVNATKVSLTKGVAVLNNGMATVQLTGGATFESIGFAENPNRLIHQGSIGEQGGTGGAGFVYAFAGSPSAISFAYTEACCPSSLGFNLLNPTGPHSAVTISDCQLAGIRIWLAPTPTASTAVVIKNNVFDRCSFLMDKGTLSAGTTSGFSLSVFNNLFNWVTDPATITGTLSYKVTFQYGNAGGVPDWFILDNVFNHTALTRLNGPSNDTDVSNNGFTTDVSTVGYNPTQGNATFQASFLGKWYQASTTYYGKGSRLGDYAGLGHHTTRTNQYPEGLLAPQMVDLGFHYVAATSSGSAVLPLDTDGDFVPDYIEDSNGNYFGPEAGETDWLDGTSFDPGVHVWISSPKESTLLP